MKILHIDLKPVGDQYAEFRFFWDNPNDYQSRQLPLAEIASLIQKAETDYYTKLPEKYTKTGQALYNWLDGSDRSLQREIAKHWRSGIVLAIAATERLAHLPWEVLHDSKSFLVDLRPAIIPIRWVKDENSKQLTLEDAPADRALNVLFMATDPEPPPPEITKKLDFDAEEADILSATKRQPLCLTVEESGCVTELGYLLKDYDQSHFDVIHLTGHAIFQEGEPCFITETEFGEAEYSSAEDIATQLQFQLPKLIFLSGCNTGYSRDAGAVPSMTERLLNQGATAVLCWGQRVLDTDATATAAVLYQELSGGMTVTQALALTYQTLLKKQARDWHLLRLYVTQTLPSALVKRGRKPVPRSSVVEEFVDSEKKLRVATRETFVGRRRQLQNCLRILKTFSQEIGVLIYGMGGLGKSTIAARLCDRLSEHEKIVWWRQIDESSLVSQLADKLKTSEQRTVLRESTQELKYRLKDVLSELNQTNEKPFLLIFDDFEWNLEHRQGNYILTTQVAEILKALVWAIKETHTKDRIIITCRYDFKSDLNEFFYKQPLESLKQSDLEKKLNRLKGFNATEIEQNLIKRAKTLADGNPRLLEWLNDEVLLQPDAKIKLDQLELNPQEWKGRIIWEELYEQLDQSIERIVSQCLVFRIPVPISILEAVCESISDYKKQLSRVVELGLIEVSPELEEANRVYRISRILPHIIPNIKLPEAPKVYSLHQKAHEKLHHLWGVEENRSKEKWQEIFRLKFANRENYERFRQGFSQMLAVQYNPEADEAFESELRKCTRELVEDGLCEVLENYLKEEQWKEADEETAWIFYQVMVKKDYKNWVVLLNNFPCKTLREINWLWLQNSNNKFGISIQREIYQSLGGTGEYDSAVWDKFGERIGWKQEDWLTYNQVIGIGKNCLLPTSKSIQYPASLPLLIYTKWNEGCGWGLVLSWGLGEPNVKIAGRSLAYCEVSVAVLGV